MSAPLVKSCLMTSSWRLRGRGKRIRPCAGSTSDEEEEQLSPLWTCRFFFLGRFFGGVKTNFPSDPFDAARTCPYVCDRSCLYCTTSRQIDTYGGVQGIPVMI